MICKKCHTEADSAYCPNCGTKMTEEQPEKKSFIEENRKILETVGLVCGIVAACLCLTGFWLVLVLGAAGITLGVLCLSGSEKPGKARASIITGAAAIGVSIITKIIVAVLISSVISSFLGNFLGNIFEPLRENITDKTSSAVEQIEEKVKENGKEKETAPASSAAEITLGTFEAEQIEDTVGYNTKLPVSVKNDSDKEKTFFISIEATAPDGGRLDTDSIFVEKLKPGETRELTAFTSVDPERIEDFLSAEYKVIETTDN